MPLDPRIEFANKENQLKLCKAVLTYLNDDYCNRSGPEHHFWYNRSIIANSFNQLEGLAAFNENDEVIGYMVWSLSPDDCRAEIDIIEVKEDVRRQGISKRMIEAFLVRYPDISVLTASVIGQAVEVFKKSGWQLHESNQPGTLHSLSPFYKCMRQSVEAQSTLPDGLAIGVYSKADEPSSTRHVDFYRVQKTPTEFQKKYFRIEIDKNGKLEKPIITSFHYEGYVGVYFNGKLFIENKAKYLFENNVCDVHGLDLLVIARIMPKDPELFYKNGLLDRPSTVEEKSAESFSDEDESESASDTQTIEDFIEELEQRPLAELEESSAEEEKEQEEKVPSHQDKKRRTIPTGAFFGLPKPSNSDEQGPSSSSSSSSSYGFRK